LERLASNVKKFFEEYYKKLFDDLKAIENQFSIKMNVYVVTEKKILMLRHSSSPSNILFSVKLRR
jgi:hypothetical protein